MIIILDRYEFNGFSLWLENKSNIILNTSNFNNEYIYIFKTTEKINE